MQKRIAEDSWDAISNQKFNDGEREVEPPLKEGDVNGAWPLEWRKPDYPRGR